MGASTAVIPGRCVPRRHHRRARGVSLEASLSWGPDQRPEKSALLARLGASIYLYIPLDTRSWLVKFSMQRGPAGEVKQRTSSRSLDIFKLGLQTRTFQRFEESFSLEL